MSRLRLVEQASAPDTPGTNEAVVYVDSSSRLSVKNDAGTVYSIGGSGVLTIPATGTPALLGTAQTFTAINTFGDAINGELFNNAADTNIANNATHAFNYSGAIVLIHDRSSAACGMFLLRGGSTATVELIDSGSLFTITKDNGGTWNVYYEGGNYYLQNKVGADRAVHIWEFA